MKIEFTTMKMFCKGKSFILVHEKEHICHEKWNCSWAS